MLQKIFRGYEITEHDDGWCIIYDKNGETLCKQPSAELARKWINEQKAKEFKKGPE